MGVWRTGAAESTVGTELGVQPLLRVRSYRDTCSMMSPSRFLRNGHPDRVSQAYEEIRSLIVRCRLAPGARIHENEAALRLGSSRTPVRAALQRLQQEGYVTGAKPGRRARATVSPLTLEDAREVFAIVGDIEGLAAERAALLPIAARRSLVRRLTRINDDYLRAASGRRPEGDQLFQLDTQFHRSYVEAGAGPRLLALHDAIKPQVERYVRVYQSVLQEAIQTSVQEHRVIVAKIETGPPEAAHLAVQTNWRNAANRMGAVIGSRGETGSW
jgi:DNA-binding GntR family transcriptional regulator